MQRVAFSPIAIVGVCVCVYVWRITRKWFEINPPFFTISTSSTNTRKPSNDVFGEVVAYAWPTFWGKRFESRPFRYIKRRYLANGDKQINYSMPSQTKLLIGFRMVYLQPDLGPFERSRSRSCNFGLWISRKRWQIGQYCYCRYIWSRLLASEWCISIWHWPILEVNIKVMQILTEYLVNGDR